MDAHELMRETLNQGRRALREPGTKPFGSLVVREGEVVGVGINRVEVDRDPTAHGEIVAIRDACHRLDTWDLSDCILFAQGEPCPLCAAAMQLAGIRELYFAADSEKATSLFAPLQGTRFADADVPSLRAEACLPATQGKSIRASRVMEADAIAVYKEWLELVRKQL
ncbi:nucleoside deaminase [Aquisalimonas sp.]|uniref:nucleoside deaminase n=1 Tax=unclassified Aquisalimonas TaxID=2644645 RepID=UPI0025BD0FDC|nr:nucleoside deaminase [Aquisalimonas sp.]